MSKYSYIGGQLVHHAYASVPLEDRGYQFADGIYEVAAYFNHTMLDGDLHLDRMERSLAALDIPMPCSRTVLEMRIKRLIALNRRRDGVAYLQCTRGVQRPRNHVFPKDLRSHLTIQILPARTPSRALYEQGVSAITTEDMRWSRCDIKTVCLLPNILSRAKASEANAREAWQVNTDGMVTEGTLSNAYIVTPEGAIKTHPTGHAILGGVTRDVLLQIAKAEKIPVIEEAFKREEAYNAAEAFMTSATSNVLPICVIDGKSIGTGKPGPVTQKLIAAYEARIFEQTGKRL